MHKVRVKATKTFNRIVTLTGGDMDKTGLSVIKQAHEKAKYTRYSPLRRKRFPAMNS